jgi:hypothetical protein
MREAGAGNTADFHLAGIQFDIRAKGFRVFPQSLQTNSVNVLVP